MAGALNVTTYTRRPFAICKGRGIKAFSGILSGAAGQSCYATSGIEKYFRNCFQIDVTATMSGTAGGYSPGVKLSATHKAGLIWMLGVYAASAISASLKPINNQAALKATFTAFGI